MKCDHSKWDSSRHYRPVHLFFVVAEHSSAPSVPIPNCIPPPPSNSTFYSERDCQARRPPRPRFGANSCLRRRDYLVAPLALLPPLSRADGHAVAEAAEEALRSIGRIEFHAYVSSDYESFSTGNGITLGSEPITLKVFPNGEYKYNSVSGAKTFIATRHKNRYFSPQIKRMGQPRPSVRPVRPWL